MYLGVTVTSNLSWSAHIDNTCVKARKQLGLLYRHFHLVGRKALSRLYKSTVLPLLDYGACVWDPHKVTKIQKLEAVQRFAAKLATGLHVAARLSGSHSTRELALPFLLVERGKSYCYVGVSSWEDLLYHLQFSHLIPILLQGSITVWHYTGQYSAIQ